MEQDTISAQAPKLTKRSLLKHNQNEFEKFIKVKWFCLINAKKR